MKRPAMACRDARGFTLIEALVALAIVAITLAAGIKAAAALSNHAGRLAQMTSAQWCAENQLAELRLSGQFPDIGESDFQCQQLGRNFTGHMQVRPTPNPNFRRVDTQMRDEQGQGLLSITTIMGRN
ncbi:type II secretion system minor pseudopilin GspI [Roseateles sp. DB2]|uniref:type II secretion system minor pseudopilin GspI n=1 Tax=Roseateles sp. DB2 TaxID=3453717 RepID=UPI003EEB1305